MTYPSDHRGPFSLIDEHRIISDGGIKRIASLQNLIPDSGGDSFCP
jgi:hypothetical protein